MRGKSVLIWIFCLLGATKIAGAQVLMKPNEKLIFSFQTKQGKRAVLVKDSPDRYLVYRYGNSKQAEFVYPSVLDSSSWSLFRYSWYLRGGGKQNDGLDLNYVQFAHGDTKYVLYETYSASDDQTQVGIRIIPLMKGEAVDMPGLKRSRRGTLIDLRDAEFIGHSEEQFD
ncbi:MAG TPA: hypothetical protein PKK69_00820 [Ferruginibacter sp.]|nr:hypothetical protein [Ferruginibacter sp.]